MSLIHHEFEKARRPFSFEELKAIADEAASEVVRNHREMNEERLEHVETLPVEIDYDAVHHGLSALYIRMLNARGLLKLDR